MKKEKITLKKIKEVCQKPGFHDCLFRKVSFYVSIPILKTNLTPTHITLVWAILAIVSGFFFYSGNYWWSLIGAVVASIGFMFDHLDGNIARYKKIFSDRGYFLDEIGSYLGIPLMLIMIGFGGYNKTGNILWLYLSIITMYGFIMRELMNRIISIKEIKGIKKTSSEKTHPEIHKKSNLLNKILPTHYDHFCYFLLILALFGVTEWILVYFGIMYNITWFGKVVYNYLYSFKN